MSQRYTASNSTMIDQQVLKDVNGLRYVQETFVTYPGEETLNNDAAAALSQAQALIDYDNAKRAADAQASTDFATMLEAAKTTPDVSDPTTVETKP